MYRRIKSVLDVLLGHAQLVLFSGQSAALVWRYTGGYLEINMDAISVLGDS